MNSDERLKAARDQLTLVLSFFSRAETKLSVVLGIDIGMLGFLASRFPKPESITIDGWLALTAFVLFNFLTMGQLLTGVMAITGCAILIKWYYIDAKTQE